MDILVVVMCIYGYMCKYEWEGEKERGYVGIGLGWERIKSYVLCGRFFFDVFF